MTACNVEAPGVGSAGAGASNGIAWAQYEDAQGSGKSVEIDDMRPMNGSNCLLLVVNETKNGSAMRSSGIVEVCLPDFLK